MASVYLPGAWAWPSSDTCLAAMREWSGVTSVSGHLRPWGLLHYPRPFLFTPPRGVCPRLSLHRLSRLLAARDGSKASHSRKSGKVASRGRRKVSRSVGGSVLSGALAPTRPISLRAPPPAPPPTLLDRLRLLPVLSSVRLKCLRSLSPLTRPARRGLSGGRGGGRPWAWAHELRRRGRGEPGTRDRSFAPRRPPARPGWQTWHRLAWRSRASST